MSESAFENKLKFKIEDFINSNYEVLNLRVRISEVKQYLNQSILDFLNKNSATILLEDFDIFEITIKRRLRNDSWVYREPMPYNFEPKNYFDVKTIAK